MLGLSQAAPSGALSTNIAAGRCCSSSSISSSLSSPLKKLTHPKTTLFSKSNAKFSPTNPRRRNDLSLITVAKVDGGVDSGPATKPSSSPFSDDSTVLVGEDTVPLEGVIQFEKPNSSSRLEKWGHIALLAGGDVLMLLLFTAIGRVSHGFLVFDLETLRTADPFIAGWFLSAYFLGGYGEDGRGMNGLTKAVIAATKSWALGIPLGLGIRAATLGHLLPINFISVTMGSTGVLLIGWRALSFGFFSKNGSKKDEIYKRGNTFELFELLTSLVRRW
ncbi:hypothetical protein Nepgr_018320 [Nepenthes gracilis]|uniref:Transmembrane protein n=1 Tax=Nepenthes gracilis TaxID=150966 RepID=A0AAD3ST75_NEPGR|nr:hypothetical protein Nepgr_018320 [Nepenthes gracilis]